MSDFNPTQHLPIVDMVTFNVLYNPDFKNKLEWEMYVKRLNAKFDHLCSIIEDDIGRPLQEKEPEIKYYVPGYGITLLRPDAAWGWGEIYLHPTQSRLAALQKWLKASFGHDLTGIISFTSIELAYDYHCPNLGLEDYNRLALRIGASIAARNGAYPFAVAIINQDYNGKKCNDGATNGRVTVYVQSTKRKGRARHSDNLKFNKKAAGHTKIYGKEIGHRPFIRIEHKLSKAKAIRNGIRFEPNNLPALLELPYLPFSRFWQFKHVELEKFIPYLRISPPLKNIQKWAWNSFLLNLENYPVADHLRYMSCASEKNKYLQRQKCRLAKLVSFEQIINTPLSDGFHISQREGNMQLPDDAELPDNIILEPFEHKPLKKSESAIQTKLL